MQKINLRELYPDVYKTDTYAEVTDEVLEALRASDRQEAAHKRQIYRYKAHYSLDRGDGIEYAALSSPLSSDRIYEDQQLRDALYAAVMALPDKQARRIYAHFYLGMTPTEIARAEGVVPSRVRESIRNGLKKLAKIF